MGAFMCLLPLLLLNSLALAFENGEDAAARGPQSPIRAMAGQPLYVFGDSYADTGNHNPNSTNTSITKPWRQPYGLTWPGHPSGRYSDGSVLTDLYVSEMHLEEPVPFRKLNVSGSDQHRPSTMTSSQLQARSRGINFAFGGSGVFSTANLLVPNVSVQVEELRTTIDLGIVSVDDILNATVLFSINGNDYTNYYEEISSFVGIEAFIPKVVEQMAVDLQELSDIGFSKFVVNTLLPVGCLPYFTIHNNYTACNSTFNGLSTYHNSILESRLSTLKEENPNATFATLDLNSAFTTIVQEANGTLMPCCKGSCGDEDEGGTPLYTVCSHPEKTLFWDIIHPTNFGWRTIIDTLFFS